jgi:3-phosphoshikimate 1-carboxyvinyltransferase
VIRGGHLTGIDYTPPVASALVKSAVLLAGLFADGPTVVREKVPTRRHTEEMLAEHGIAVTSETDDGGSTVIELHPGAVRAGDFVVPGDPSQAAFWICSAAAIPGSDVTVENLYLAPERSGFLEVLLDMGADLEIDRSLGTVRARGTELHGAVVSGAQISDVIDEVPALAVAGAFAASGTLRFEDAGELRSKESDRIETVAAAISALGGAVATGSDLLEVSAQPLRAGSIASHNDHRIAMATAVATTGMPEGSNVEVDDWSCVATSYPGFLEQLRSLVG